MEIDLNQLPIPDWGLRCPTCRYDLQGLPSHRCPECGGALDIPALVRSWHRLRAPTFTGRELPVPDFGLTCDRCEAALAGARLQSCPACGEPFDLQTRRPARKWFNGLETTNDVVAVHVLLSELARAYIPYVAHETRSAFTLYHGSPTPDHRVQVASEFYFDFLYLVQQERHRWLKSQALTHTAWYCTQCHEENPGNFGVCWNCQAARPGD